MTDTGITVAGRQFRPVTPRRMEHFQYITFKLLVAGAMDGGTIPELCAKVSEYGYGADIFTGLYAECDAEGPLPWRLERARELAKSLKENRWPTAKGTPPVVLTTTDWSTLSEALMFGLSRFFGRAAVSSSDSPTSSDEPAATRSPTTVANAPPVPSGSPS